MDGTFPEEPFSTYAAAGEDELPLADAFPKEEAFKRYSP